MVDSVFYSSIKKRIGSVSWKSEGLGVFLSFSFERHPKEVGFIKDPETSSDDVQDD